MESTWFLRGDSRRALLRLRPPPPRWGSHYWFSCSLRKESLPGFPHSSSTPFCLPSILFVHRAHPVALLFFLLLFSFSFSLTHGPSSFLLFSSAARRRSPLFRRECVNRKVEVCTRAYMCGNASRNAGQRSYGTTSGAFFLHLEFWRTLPNVVHIGNFFSLPIGFSLHKHVFVHCNIYVYRYWMIQFEDLQAKSTSILSILKVEDSKRFLIPKKYCFCYKRI